MKSRVAAVIESFENEEITETVALSRIRELTGREVDAYWLRSYWRSESREDFVDRLCAQPIRNFEGMTDADAIALITELLQTQSPGRQASIEEALDRRFGKPSGTVRDVVRRGDLSTPSRILAELKRNTRIYL